MKQIFILLAAACLAIPLRVHGWGKTGHEIASELAYNFLDPTTREKLNNYLGTSTPEGASTWMDKVRSNHNYDYMKPWHYVDYEKGTDYQPNNDENLVNELEKVIGQLEHKDRLDADKIKTNLEIIFHLVEDMHQPLHIGYADDRGGNTIIVDYLGKTKKLHHVWDDDIIKTGGIGYEKCIVVYTAMRRADIKKLQKGTIVQWLKEPRQLLQDVYNFNDNKIDQAYVDRNIPVIEKQLVIAGIRLAVVLERILK
jgi:hypothetical protein